MARSPGREHRAGGRGSAHRQAAFDAANFLMDFLKSPRRSGRRNIASTARTAAGSKPRQKTTKRSNAGTACEPARHRLAHHRVCRRPASGCAITLSKNCHFLPGLNPTQCITAAVIVPSVSGETPHSAAMYASPSPKRPRWSRSRNAQVRQGGPHTQPSRGKRRTRRRLSPLHGRAGRGKCSGCARSPVRPARWPRLASDMA